MPELPTIPGFRIIEELGIGSLSSIYKAVEEPLGRRVALKVMKTTIAMTSPFASQLEREARVLAELCHPNVGLLYAFAKNDAGMYLVFEFVDGCSVATLLKKKPTVPADSVAAIGAQVARGLAHAHERGVVHRDIKPSNVLMSLRGEVKIFDFGIARRSNEDPVGLAPMRLDDVATFGTPAYMSPEQILGESVDGRSDVFSLGVILYQLVCGARPPVRARRRCEPRPTAHRIRRDPPIPLHRRAPDVPLALERIIMRSIEKLPADRFQTAEALAEHLEEFVSLRSGLRGDKLVVVALEHAGLTNASTSGGAAPAKENKRAPVRKAALGLAILSTIAVASGVLLQATSHREGQAAGTGPLELAPPSPGFLRILATPWAEVWVDGQRVDVTPFARAIPLAGGTHYVTLVHPNAPVEKRTVVLASGETRTIDVVMAVSDLGVKTDGGASEPSAEREKK